jgi:hypothetical protein
MLCLVTTAHRTNSQYIIRCLRIRTSSARGIPVRVPRKFFFYRNHAARTSGVCVRRSRIAGGTRNKTETQRGWDGDDGTWWIQMISVHVSRTVFFLTSCQCPLFFPWPVLLEQGEIFNENKRLTANHASWSMAMGPNETPNPRSTGRTA